MATIPMSARETERVAVFSYAEPFPIVPEPGIIAVVVNPLNGKIFAHADSLELVIHAIRKHGMIAYALADLAVPEELGELDAYWTVERAQRLYDHHRGHYVNGD